MIKKKLESVAAFCAGDCTLLREVLHPEREGIDLSFSVAHARLLPGGRSLPHVLHTRDEVCFVMKREGIVHVGDI